MDVQDVPLDIKDQKEIYVAGPPVDKDAQVKIGINNYIPLQGSIQCDCGICNEKVWIGPKQEVIAEQARSQAKAVYYTCFSCSFYLQYMFRKPDETSDLKVSRAGDEGGTYEIDHHKLTDIPTNLGRNMELFTIYDKPTDEPDKFVLRRWTIVGSKPTPDAEYQTADSLEDIRKLLPPGLSCMSRNPTDDPKIVETWI